MIDITHMIDAFRRAETPPPRSLVAFCRWALQGSGYAVGLAVGMSIIAGVTEMFAAFATGWIIDTAGAGDAASFLDENWPVLLAGLGFFLLMRPLIFVLDAAMTSIMLGPNLFPLIASRLHRHTLGQSMEFFDNDFAGRIAQKEIQTANALTSVVTEIINIMTYGLAMFVGGFVLLGGIGGWLVLALAVWFSLYLLLIRVFLPRIRVRARARAAARAMVTGQIVDTLSNISTVKLFAHDEHEDRAALEALGTYRNRALEFGFTTARFRFLMMTLGGTLPVLMLGLTLWLWLNGRASAGDIAVAAMVATRLSQIVNRIAFTALSVFSSIGEVEDGMRTLSPAHGISDPQAPRTPDARQGAVAFENVSFGYGRDTAALDGFSLRVKPGEKVALVGASGAGKTTAMSLLLRLYDVEAGRITLDGVDIRDMMQTDLRQQISVVRQDAAMFNRSARDNIRYGRPDAAEDAVFRAAELAQAHEFILALSDHTGRLGYDAHLGERGVKLSGGQRQRIAIARAILKDAPLLVLDEATSALDSEVEAEIQSALDAVMAGKTVIAIAHRLSTIARMDRIVVLEAGRVVESGSHAELLANKGLYARLWDRQSGGFIGLKAAE